MESFALGRPVLSTRINGIPELLDDSCGWLAEPGDQETLAACLQDLLSKPVEELTLMGATGRQRVIERHDQARSAALLRDLITEKPI